MFDYDITDTIKVEILAKDLHDLVASLKMLNLELKLKKDKINELEEKIKELTTTKEKGDN